MSSDDEGFDRDNMRQQDVVYDGRRVRKSVARRWIDYNMSWVLFNQDRPFGKVDQYMQNIPNEYRILYPAVAYDNLAVNIGPRLIRGAANKVSKTAINGLAWQPDGTRIVAGHETGHITLFWDKAFHYDHHVEAKGEIQELIWSHDGEYMLTVDKKNILKVWQRNYHPIESWVIHEPDDPRDEPKRVRQLSFSPCDRKFASACDDAHIKIWDFSSHQEEHDISCAGSEMKTVDWHQSKSIIAAGGKDNTVKFFDPRDAKTLATIDGHKNCVHKVQWNPNGNWLLSCSKDCSVRLYDVRMMREMQAFHAYDEEIYTVEWHPTQEELFVSGDYKGDMCWWAVGVDKPVYALEKAHSKAILQLKYHPVGHLLASTGKEMSVKLWARSRAGSDVSKSSNESQNQQHITSNPAATTTNLDIPGLGKFTEVFPDAVVDQGFEMLDTRNEPEQFGDEM